MARPPLAAKEHQVVELPDDPLDDRIEEFFTKNRLNADLFNAGVRATIARDAAFFDQPLRTPILEALELDELEIKWREFRARREIGDFIFVRDTTSLMSTLIAAIDHGTWSHVGVYSGSGQILEATTSGVVERLVDVYRPPRYRLGLYRLPALAEVPSVDRRMERLRSQLGKPYNYRGAVRLGLRKILGIRPTQPTRRDVSPNDLARAMRLIYLV